MGTFGLQGQLLALQWLFVQEHIRVGAWKGFIVGFVVLSILHSLLPGTV